MLDVRLSSFLQWEQDRRGEGEGTHKWVRSRLESSFSEITANAKRK